MVTSYSVLLDLQVGPPTWKYMYLQHSTLESAGNVSSAALPLVVSRVRSGRRKYRGPAAFTFCGCLLFLRPFLTDLSFPLPKFCERATEKEI